MPDDQPQFSNLDYFNFENQDRSTLEFKYILKTNKHIKRK